MEVEEAEDLTWKNKGNAAYKQKNFDEKFLKFHH